MDDVTFLAPHQFPPLELSELLNSEREGRIFDAAFSGTNGYPYDVVQDIPTEQNGLRTTKARGGALHFTNVGQAGEDFPTSDRGYWYEVTDSEVTTKAFWGQTSSDYLQTKVKDGDVSVWGYNKNGSRQFVLAADDASASSTLRLFNQNNDKYASISISNSESEVYGYYANTTKYYLLKADAIGVSLTLDKDGDKVFVDHAGLNAIKPSGDSSSIGASYWEMKTSGASEKISFEVSNGNTYARFESGDYKAVINNSLFSIDKDNGSAEVSLDVTGGDAFLTLKQDQKKVEITVPEDSNGTKRNAKWVEIDVCKNGYPQKMLVLATDPY